MIFFALGHKFPSLACASTTKLLEYNERVFCPSFDCLPFFIFLSQFECTDRKAKFMFWASPSMVLGNEAGKWPYQYQ